MDLETELQSISAIKNCMEDLGFINSDEPKFSKAASLYNTNNYSSGNIKITFVSNWHSGDGPYIETDDTIKSFGIFHTYFKPKWQIFTYAKETKELTVSGDDYEFVIEFK